jgi:hypothetical protein
MTSTATITAPTIEEAPLYRRAETRLAVVGKGKRIHYSANDDSLCGKAITRYTDIEEAATLGYEHCGRCIHAAEDRAYSISLAGASPLMAALHDVVNTVEAVDAERAAQAAPEAAAESETPAEDARTAAPEDDAPAAEIDAPESPAGDDADDAQESAGHFPAVDAPADAVDPTTIRPGDLVEGVIASNRPGPIRVRVDRAPWKINDRCTVLCDGRGVDAVYTHTLRIIGDDTEPDGATPADVPAALATFARIASTPAPAVPAAPVDEPPADSTPAEAAPASLADEPQPQDDASAIPADLIRLSINPRSGTVHLGAITEHGPAIICGQYVSPSLAPLGDGTAHRLCPTCERSLALYLLANADFEPERRLPEGTKSTAIAHYVFPDQNLTYCGKTAGDGTPGKKARVCSKCDGHRAGLVAFRAAAGDTDAA